MQVLTRHAQRILAGQEDNSPELVWSPGWLLTLNPGGPQAGSVGYHGNRFTHRIQEALTDGGVYTRDRQLYEALMGLGVYSSRVAPSAYNYSRGILLDRPVAYWRLGEAAGSTVAVDLMGVLNGTYMGSQSPNIVPQSSFEGSITSWQGRTNAAGTNTIAQSAAVTPFAGTKVLMSTTTVAGDVYAAITTAGQFAVTPNTAYTVSAYGQAAQAGESWFVTMIFYDSTKTQIGSAHGGTTITLPVGSWSRMSSANVVSPANAAYCSVRIESTASALNAVNYFDAVQMTATTAVVPYSDTQGVSLGSSGLILNDPDTSVLLDGFSGWVDCGVPPATLKPTSGLTCEAWFATTPGGGTTEGLIGNWGSGVLGYILRIVSSFRLEMWVGGTVYTSTSSYNDGNRHHAVGTWDGSTISLYVDGLFVGSKAFAGPLNYSNTNRFMLGGYSSNASPTLAQPYDGYLDEVAVYNYPLSLNQVQAHYAARQ